MPRFRYCGTSLLLRYAPCLLGGIGMDTHRLVGTGVPLTGRDGGRCERDVLRLVADHRRLGELCDLLECCADELPAMPPASVVEQICEALTELMGQDVSDPSPYPDVASLYDPTDPLALVLMKEVHARHAADTLHAQDLVDALRGVPDMTHRLSPDTIGYMLRCFFEGCRQAMNCEELAILALARDRLPQSTHRILIDSLRRRSRSGRKIIGL